MIKPNRGSENRNWVSRLIVVVAVTSSLAAETDRRKEQEDPIATPSAATSERSFRIDNFHADLGRNFVALFSRANLAPLLIGTGGASAAYAVDDEVAEFFGGGSRLGKVQEWGNVLGKSWLIGGTVGTMMLVGRYKGSDSFRRLSYSLGQGFVLTGGLTFGLKQAVKRERPDSSNSRSFPSGHTSQAFAFATILSQHHSQAAIPAYLTAGLIAVSRLDRDVHYLSDVAAGAVLGYIVGRTVVRQAEKQSRVTVLPYVSMATGDVAVTVQIVLP